MRAFNWRQWSLSSLGLWRGVTSSRRRKGTPTQIETLEERTLPSFASPVISDYNSVDGYLAQETTGDFNGDGKLDIATLSYLNMFDPLRLNVMIGQGDGSFQAQPTIALSNVINYTSFDLEAGRINGDTYDDLVILEGSFQMKVFFGSANGLSTASTGVTNLTPCINFGPAIQSGELILGHFTQTDHLDAAILPTGGNVMRILSNNGDGTFVEHLYPLQTASHQNVNFAANFQSVDEGDQSLKEDLNHDGIDDTIFTFGVAGNSPGSQTGVVTIRKTDGPEGYAVSSVTAISNGQDLKGADLDVDGLLDIAVNSLDGTGGLKLFKGQSDGSFQAFASSPFVDGTASTSIASMAFANFVGAAAPDLLFNPTDGIPDPNNGGDTKYVFGVATGQGSAVFAAPAFLDRHQNGSNESLITGAGRIFIADVNADGAPDLLDIYRAFAAGQHARTSVLLNTGGTHTTLAFPNLEEGSPITIEATVAKNSAEAQGVPTGTVTFLEGDTVLGQAQIVDGVATSDEIFLDPGQHTIRAVYGGDDNFLSSAAAATQINVIVNPNRTKTTVTFPNLNEGDALFQANVTKYFQATPGDPVGTVVLKEGDNTVGEGTLVGGQLVATLDLGAGQHTITAFYTGDGSFTPSKSKPITINIIPAPLPNLGLLHIEAEGGGLQFNRANHHFEASGVIHIGLDAPQFQSLIDFSGSISIGTDSIVADGTATAHIGSYSQELFHGHFQFNIGNAVTETFNALALPSSLKLGGMDIDVTQFELVDGGINLGGRLHLPNGLGNNVLDIAVSEGIHIDANGVSSHFIGGEIGFPGVNFNLAGLGITATELSADYDADHDRLKIHGKIGLPDLFGGFISGVQLNLTGNDFIQIQHGEVGLIGDLNIKRIDIVPNNWYLKDVKLHLNTVQNTFEGSGTLFIPGGFGISADIGLVNGQLDTVQLGVDGLNVAVPFLPGAFLKSLSGGVHGLTTAHPTYEGDAGFTYLPHVTFDMPGFLGGQHYDISLVSLKVQAQINDQHLTATGTVELLKGVSGSGQNDGSPASVDMDWLKRAIHISADIHLIDNIVKLDIDFNGNAKGNVTFQADASLSLPDIDTHLLGVHIKAQDVLGAHAEFQFTNDSNPANDSVALWGNIDLPVVGIRRIGIRLHFDGKVDFIGLLDPVGQTFNIPAGSDMFMLTASWENDVGNVPLQITDPNGHTYDEADFDNVNIGVIDPLSGPKSKSVGLLNPIPGNWTITIPNEAGLGQTAFYGFHELAAPTLQVNSVTPGTSNVAINYDAQSDESTSTVAWYYDTDNTGFNGALIAVNQNALGSGQTFNWDTTGIPAGTYYIYGKVDDGINPSTFAYAPVSVTIANQAPDLTAIDNQSVTEGQTLTLTATATDPNGDIVTYSLGAGAPAGVDIDPATGELTWTPTEAQGPNVYNITVVASDFVTPSLSNSRTFQVTVDEVNSAPTVNHLFAQSRPQGGTFGFTATATDSDAPAQTLQFSLDAGAPQGATINPTTGAFTWPVGDEQTPGVYPVTIRVTDNGTGNLSGTATVNLTVREAAAVVIPGTFQFSAPNYSVDEGGNVTVTVTRTGGSDGVVAVQYSATGVSATAGADFDTTGGYLVFDDAQTSQTFSFHALFDSSTEGPETVTLALLNPTDGDLGDQNTALVTIGDVVSVPPVFSSPSTYNVVENQTAVGLVSATDADIPAQTVTFSITGGTDAAKFAITSGGTLTFINAPDFDQPGDSNHDNIYQVQITADDGHGGTVSQTISVTVTGVNDNSPAFTTGAAFTIDENSTDVGTVLATDADVPDQTVTYSITGGSDQSALTITSGGMLSFISAPDFENPGDSNDDNVYEVQITANDGNGRTTVQNVSVTVNNVSDGSPAPVLTLGSSAVTWINKHPAVVVLPSVTVTGGANLNGGTLLLAIKFSGTLTKPFDSIHVPSASSIGTALAPQFVDGRLIQTIQLNGNATDASVQAFLRGITFATKGKGLKLTPRTASVVLTDNAFHSSSFTQTINILKKAPPA